jgi:hypothetical protein
MDPVSDSFLLTVASISAALIGLFIVGMIFYIQSGYESNERSREVVEPYFRAATAITLIAYAIPLTVSLTLVALPIVWSRLLLLVLVVALVIENVATVGTVRAVVRVAGLRLLAMIEIVGTVSVVIMVVLPLALGGLSPGREDLVPSILLSLGVAFLGTGVLVMTLFDIARFERSEVPAPMVTRTVGRLRRRGIEKRPDDERPTSEPSPSGGDAEGTGPAAPN